MIPTSKQAPIATPSGYNATLSQGLETGTSSSGSLSGVSIGGIVIGSLAGVAVLALAVWFTVRRLNGRSNSGMFNSALNRSALRLGNILHIGGHNNPKGGPDMLVGTSAMGGLYKEPEVGVYDQTATSGTYVPKAAYSTGTGYGHSAGISMDSTVVNHRGSEGEGSGSAGAGSRRGSWWKKEGNNIGVAF